MIMNRNIDKKFPITVIIPTINAEGHLEELFDSVLPYVEDLYIVDSRSVDRTVDICLDRGVKIIQRPFKRPSEQLDWMIKNLPIKTPWIFDMAQDERFSDSLIVDFKRLFEEGIPDDVDCYAFKWRLWFMGEPLHAMSRVNRLLRKGRCHVSDVACDEHFYVDGKIVQLDGIVEHKDTLNLHQWYEKQNLWTTLGAVGRITDCCQEEKLTPFGTWLQRKMFFKRVCIRTPIVGKLAMWMYYYFGFGAWKDGFAGWHWAQLRMWVNHVTDIKEKEFRKHGIPKCLPTARHGDFDPRIMQSDLQQQLLPDVVAEWRARESAMRV